MARIIMVGDYGDRKQGQTVTVDDGEASSLIHIGVAVQAPLPEQKKETKNG